jgi:hypothetical protein
MEGYGLDMDWIWIGPYPIHIQSISIFFVGQTVHGRNHARKLIHLDTIGALKAVVSQTKRLHFL